MQLSVLGAGSFGTAMANHAAELGHQVMIWCRRKEQADAIREQHHNPDYFKDYSLSPNVTATANIAECADFSQRILLAVPSQSLRCALEIIPRGNYQFLNLAKGIEITSGQFLHQMMMEIQPQSGYSALSGPSHAEEVIQGKPTAVVVASQVQEEAVHWQELLNAPCFRVYTEEDVIGVEIGGAVKNVIAIAVGIARGMSLGDNALAALATRGLAELMRLGIALKADPMTLMGLAGVGDLMATCYSPHSRNVRFGLAIGQGKSADEAMAEVKQVVEGAHTTRALITHAEAFKLDLPLTQSVYNILYSGASIQETMGLLLAREPKPERIPFKNRRLPDERVNSISSSN